MAIITTVAAIILIAYPDIDCPATDKSHAIVISTVHTATGHQQHLYPIETTNK